MGKYLFVYFSSGSDGLANEHAKQQMTRNRRSLLDHPGDEEQEADNTQLKTENGNSQNESGQEADNTQI